MLGNCVILQVVNHAVLQDWEGLRPYVSFPRYLRYLSWRSHAFLPERVSTFFLLQQLELACYISAAFLLAHRMTRNHLRGFIGKSLACNKIQNPSLTLEHAAN
jgi:hypothetical protein